MSCCGPLRFWRCSAVLRWCDCLDDDQLPAATWARHGRSRLAVTQLQWLMVDCSRVQTDDPELCAAADRVQSRSKALLTYLSNNMGSLCDYGARYRSGLAISTSRAEGCVDDIANTRMGKKRRMRWSPRGAHRVAVTRAAALDARLTVSHRKIAA